jgi:hypothetical protein
MATTKTDISNQPVANQNVAMSIEDFYEALEKHDWFHFWADSRHVSEAGEKSQAKIEEAARIGGERYQWLYSEYGKYMVSGKPWNTPKHPKPPAPGKTAKVAVDSLNEADESDTCLSSSGYYVPNVGKYTGQTRVLELIKAAWFYTRHLMVAVMASVR